MFGSLYGCAFVLALVTLAQGQAGAYVTVVVGLDLSCQRCAGSSSLFLSLRFCLLSLVVDNLVFIFFEYLGSSYTVMGLTVLLTVSFEIPIFRLAPRLLERLGSGKLLLVASTCYIVRAVGYSCIPKGHILYVLVLEPLHGITYACSQVSFALEPCTLSALAPILVFYGCTCLDRTC